MTDGIIQKVIKRNLTDMALENSYLDCTCGYCKLGRTIEQELIEEIKKACNKSYMNCGLTVLYESDLIGDNE